jgi:protein ImuB
VAVDPTAARIVHGSLLARPEPSPEQVSTLIARLDALMGQGRSGSPALVDSWRPGACAVVPFRRAATEAARDTAADARRRPSSSNVAGLTGRSDTGGDALPVSATPMLALRRFRLPVPARVRAEAGRPVRVTTDRRGLSGGVVTACAGPWRASGGWWNDAPPAASPAPWDRDEWEVTLADGATYLIVCERDTAAWFVEGILD